MKLFRMKISFICLFFVINSFVVSIVYAQSANFLNDGVEECTTAGVIASLRAPSLYYSFLLAIEDETSEYRLATIAVNGSRYLIITPDSSIYARNLDVTVDPPQLADATDPFTSTLNFTLLGTSIQQYRFLIRFGNSNTATAWNNRSTCPTNETVSCNSEPCFCNSIAQYTCITQLPDGTGELYENQTQICQSGVDYNFDICRTFPIITSFATTSNLTQGNDLTVVCDYEDGISAYNTGQIVYNNTYYSFTPGVPKNLGITLSRNDQDQIIYCQALNNFTVDNNVNITSEIKLNVAYFEAESNSTEVEAILDTSDSVEVFSFSCNPNISDANIYMNGSATATTNIFLQYEYSDYTQLVSIKPTEGNWINDYSGWYRMEVTHIAGVPGLFEFQLNVRNTGTPIIPLDGLEDWEIALIAIAAVLVAGGIVAAIFYCLGLFCFAK